MPGLMDRFNNLPEWARIFVVWSLIGIGVLLTGGVAFRALAALRSPATVHFGSSFWCPLLLFGIGGGISIGLLILTWWLVTQRGFSWTLGFVVLGIVLFALFVWPTRYVYYPTDKKTTLLKVERLTGKAEFIPGPP